MHGSPRPSNSNRTRALNGLGITNATKSAATRSRTAGTSSMWPSLISRSLTRSVHMSPDS